MNAPAGLLSPDFEAQIRLLAPEHAAYVLHRVDWLGTARAAQLPPDPEDQANWIAALNEGLDPAKPDKLKAQALDPHSPWLEFGIQAGRGFGKTRPGAEWLFQAAWEDPQTLPRCVVAPTQNDARFTCFEGEGSGLLSVIPPACIENYNRTELVLTLKNGAIIRGFSAEKPDRLRGPNHADAWCFAAGTPVLMADGSYRNIETVKRGEMVATRFGPRRVLKAGRSRNPNPWVELAIRTQIEGDLINLRCTVDHPIWANGAWKAAGDLQPGDELSSFHLAGDVSDRHTLMSEPAYLLRSKIVRRKTFEDLARRRPRVLRRKWKPGDDPFRPANKREIQSMLRQDSCFCLTVEGEHEFIAGGIVVHNCDELAAWGPDGEDVWDMMEMGLRIGARPRIFWSSTPKPNALIRRLTQPKAGRIIVRGSTYDNAANLAETFLKKVMVYDGTKLGNQELLGELLDPEEAGIIRRSWLRLWPADKPLPSFQWIIMSLDTAFTEKTLDKKGDADPTACTVWGVFTHEKRTNVLLLDCWEDHLGLPELARRVRKEMNNRYGDDEDDAVIRPMIGSAKPVGSGRKPDILLIEDKGSGISLRQTLAEQGIEAYAYNPGRADKLARLHIVSPIFAQRRVWVPESAKLPGKPRNWCEPLIAQLCSFTGEGSVKHDDLVDSTTQSIRLMMDKQLLAMTKPPEERRDYVPPPPEDYSNPYDC